MDTTTAAEKLNVSRRRVIQLISRGRLRASRGEGGIFIIAPGEVENFHRMPRGRPRRACP